MSLKGFKADDSKKVVDLLNIVATKAKFNDMSVEDIITVFRLLNFAQRELIPMVDALVVDDIKVTEAPKPAPKAGKNKGQ